MEKHAIWPRLLVVLTSLHAGHAIAQSIDISIDDLPRELEVEQPEGVDISALPTRLLRYKRSHVGIDISQSLSTLRADGRKVQDERWGQIAFQPYYRMKFFPALFAIEVSQTARNIRGAEGGSRSDEEVTFDRFEPKVTSQLISNLHGGLAYEHVSETSDVSYIEDTTLSLRRWTASLAWQEPSFALQLGYRTAATDSDVVRSSADDAEGTNLDTRESFRYTPIEYHAGVNSTWDNSWFASLDTVFFDYDRHIDQRSYFGGYKLSFQDKLKLKLHASHRLSPKWKLAASLTHHPAAEIFSQPAVGDANVIATQISTQYIMDLGAEIGARISWIEGNSDLERAEGGSRQSLYRKGQLYGAYLGFSW